MKRENHWMMRLFILLFSISVSVVIVPCGVVNVYGALGEVYSSVTIDDKMIQLILKKLNNTTLLHALAGASGAVCKRFMSNISGRMVSFLDVQLEKNKFSTEKIEDAQKAILQIYSMIKE